MIEIKTVTFEKEKHNGKEERREDEPNTTLLEMELPFEYHSILLPQNPKNQRTLLLRASERGDVEQIAYLISAGVPVDGLEYQGYTPLFASLKAPDHTAFRFLKQNGADIRITHKGIGLAEALAFYCSWPLAQKDGVFTMLEIYRIPLLLSELRDAVIEEAGLIEKIEKIDPSIRAARLKMIFLAACANGHTQLVKSLLTRKLQTFVWKSPLLTENHQGYTALSLATMNGRTDTVNWLISLMGGVNVNESYYHSSKLKKGELISEKTENAFDLAAQNGHLTTLQCLLKSVSRKHHKEVVQSALRAAARGGQIAVIEWLMQAYGIKIHEEFKYHQKPIFIAVEQEQIHLLHWLLKLHPGEAGTLDRESSSALLFPAIQNKNLEMVRFLLPNADVKVRDEEGNTPLLVAAKTDHIEIVACLVVEGGSDLIDRNNEGRSALMVAAQYDCLNMVQFLLTCKLADLLNHKSVEREETHLLAAQRGSLDRTLAILSETDKKGNTAWLLAAQYGSLQTLQWMFSEMVIDVEQKNQEGNTALLLAVQGGHLAIVKWLLRHAKANIKTTNQEVDEIDKKNMSALKWITKKCFWSYGCDAYVWKYKAFEKEHIIDSPDNYQKYKGKYLVRLEGEDYGNYGSLYYVQPNGTLETLELRPYVKPFFKRRGSYCEEKYNQFFKLFSKINPQNTTPIHLSPEQLQMLITDIVGHSHEKYYPLNPELINQFNEIRLFLEAFSNSLKAQRQKIPNMAFRPNRRAKSYRLPPSPSSFWGSPVPSAPKLVPAVSNPCFDDRPPQIVHFPKHTDLPPGYEESPVERKQIHPNYSSSESNFSLS